MGSDEAYNFVFKGKIGHFFDGVVMHIKQSLMEL